MTRKDYVAIAKVLAENRKYLESNDAGMRELAFKGLVNDLVKVFQSDNARFDVGRFVKAVMG